MVGPGEEAPDDLRIRHSWLRELVSWYDHFNRIYLHGALTAPSFVLHHRAQVLGFYEPRHRRLGLQVEHLWNDSWRDVMVTLRHEMAHQYAYEVLKALDEPPHGPAFRRACESLRVEARDDGCERLAPSGGSVESAADGALHAKIEKLLSLAESPNEHEARAAMNKARHLLLQHNLEARDVQGRAREAFHDRDVGEAKARRATWEYVLGGLLGDYFFVHALWDDVYDVRAGKRCRVLRLYGTSTNLDMAEYVHGFLTALLPRLWRDYKAAHGLSSDRPRRNFYEGVLVGVSEMLAEQELRLREEHALIWNGDPALDRHFHEQQPAVQSRGHSSSGYHDPTLYEAAKEQGRHVRIHKPLSSGGDGTSRHLGA